MEIRRTIGAKSLVFYFAVLGRDPHAWVFPSLRFIYKNAPKKDVFPHICKWKNVSEYISLPMVSVFCIWHMCICNSQHTGTIVLEPTLNTQMGVLLKQFSFLLVPSLHPHESWPTLFEAPTGSLGMVWSASLSSPLSPIQTSNHPLPTLPCTFLR